MIEMTTKNLLYKTNNMKNLALLISLFAFQGIFAQISAVTQNGDEVVLYDNGTWSFAGENKEQEAKEIPLNELVFEKDKSAIFLIKSTKTNTGLWINPKKWNFSKAGNDTEAEYELVLKEGDLYALIITEKMEIPLEALKNIVLENAKNVAPDAKIKHEEYRIVNGLKILQLEIDGTVQGIKFSYFGYYFSNEKGTTQLISYTSQNLMKKSKNVCEELLNGFVVFEK